MRNPQISVSLAKPFISAVFDSSLGAVQVLKRSSDENGIKLVRCSDPISWVLYITMDRILYIYIYYHTNIYIYMHACIYLYIYDY